MRSGHWFFSVDRISSLDQRMGDRLLRPQEVTPENLTVAVHAIAVVLGDKSVALGSVVGRQFVPGQPGSGMVGDMQIVVEEKQGPEGRGLDDDGPLAFRLGRLVLAEGTNEHECDAGIGEEQHILPEGDAAYPQCVEKRYGAGRHMEEPGLNDLAI